jgi:hypothetical protein
MNFAESKHVAPKSDTTKLARYKNLASECIVNIESPWPSLPTKNPYENPTAFVENAELEYAKLEEPVRRKLMDFRQHGNDDGALLIKGLSRDENIPATPTIPNTDAIRESFKAEFAMAAIGRYFGEPVGYAQEKLGKIFQGMYPIAKQANLQTNSSSSTALKFHTESCFHPHLPDYLILIGLRQDTEKATKTIVSSVRRALPHLTLTQRSALFKAEFRTQVDLSFGGGPGPLLSVFSGDPADPYIRFDDDFYAPTTAEAGKALEALRTAIDREKVAVCVAPGDILILDNRRCVHARSEFVAHHDGTDRWLLRVSIVREIRNSWAERLAGQSVIASDNFSFNS